MGVTDETSTRRVGNAADLRFVPTIGMTEDLPSWWPPVEAVLLAEPILYFGYEEYRYSVPAANIVGDVAGSPSSNPDVRSARRHWHAWRRQLRGQKSYEDNKETFLVKLHDGTGSRLMAVTFWDGEVIVSLYEESGR